MTALSTRLVIGASSIALLFGALSGTGVAAADSEGNQVVASPARKTIDEKRQHRKVRKVAGIGSTNTCAAQCQLEQHFNNYGYAEARLFLPSNEFSQNPYN